MGRLISSEALRSTPALALQPMRVLLAIEACGGGAGRHALDLAEGLAERGHHVALLYSPTRADASFLERMRSLPIVTVRVPMERSVGLADIGAFSAVRRAVQVYGPFDVLHAHSSKAGALLRAVPSKAAKVYTQHAFRTMDPGAGSAARRVYGSIETTLARFASDRVIAVSAAEQAHAIEHLGIPRERVALVANGVADTPLRARAEVRAELGVERSDTLVGFVGRLSHQKNPELFLRSIWHARQAHPSIRGLILGDGELASQVESLRDSLGLGNAVTIISGCKATDYFSGMDCFAMTSRYEAMPYVLLEALAAGLPIVSTPVGGTRETVRPYETGLVVPPDEVKVAAALARIASDELLRRRLAGGASDLATSFTLDIMISTTLDVYRSAVLAVGEGRRLEAA